MVRRLLTFVNNVRVEMGKVSWSSRQALMGSTWVVLISSAFLALVVGVFDFLCSTAVRAILR